MYPLGRSAWSLTIRNNMAVGLGSKAADEEARAEVEVLNSRLEKTSQLSKRIQASLARLEDNGKTMQEAIGPVYGNTKRLQILGNNIDAVISAIEKIKQPSDIKSNEEEIIRKGPDKAGLTAFLNSVKRVNQALTQMKKNNLRTNQATLADLGRLSKQGNGQLEQYFIKLLQEDSRPIEPLQYITKDKPFPNLDPQRTTPLGLINTYIASSMKSGDSPVIQLYASVRGPYLTSILQNLASASVNTARKKNPDAMYRQGTNGIGMYAKGLEGAFLAEYDNICGLFARDEWPKVFNLTCQGAISEFSRTLRELNAHIKQNLTTDCYLAYEIIEIMSNLSSNLEERTGELKPSFAAALKPIKETGKSSLADLLEDTRRRINGIQAIDASGAALPITSEVMTRLQTMVDFLRPVSSIMISIGDGGWKTNSTSNNSTEHIPTLNSFDVTADGKQIFAHYCIDTINTLQTSLDQKGKFLLKSKPTLGIFLANNANVVDRMIRGSDLQPLLASRMGDIDKWRKDGIQMYTNAWKECPHHLFDVQYTNRGTRPPSGTAASVDSIAIVKNMSSKEKDSVKEKFQLFNASFSDLVSKHKALLMEREVRESVAKQIRALIEPLYCRYWDRYHEVDKGKGKYVKYNKAEISGVFLSLG